MGGILLAIGILLGVSVDLIIFYVCEDGFEWEYERSEKLRLPSVLDLDTDDKSTINRYVENEIIPACKYFFLRSEFKLYNPVNDTAIVELGYLIYLNVHAYILLLNGAVSIWGPHSLLKFIVIAPIFVCYFVAKILYKKKIKLQEFKLSDDEIERLRKESEKAKKEYGEPSFCFLNNQLIHKRLNYLVYHEEKIRNRVYLRKIVTPAAAIVYLLFIRSVYKELHADRETGC